MSTKPSRSPLEDGVLSTALAFMDATCVSSNGEAVKCLMGDGEVSNFVLKVVLEEAMDGPMFASSAPMEKFARDTTMDLVSPVAGVAKASILDLAVGDQMLEASANVQVVSAPKGEARADEGMAELTIKRIKIFFLELKQSKKDVRKQDFYYLPYLGPSASSSLHVLNPASWSSPFCFLKYATMGI
ncbi:uncharacterized protein LOC107304215 [Oryza brachyantha]|uniref:uncharacterized protein LOC107304215 n=1 Tax=Oryza brachyantha TaxID=4533 RepID=UPI0007768C6D|nr:uncharacterized protein LOC107304215 [Oryza brachyantha]